jgi:hypothetical protein
MERMENSEDGETGIKVLVHARGLHGVRTRDETTFDIRSPSDPGSNSSDRRTVIPQK